MSSFFLEGEAIFGWGARLEAWLACRPREQVATLAAPDGLHVLWLAAVTVRCVVFEGMAPMTARSPTSALKGKQRRRILAISPIRLYAYSLWKVFGPFLLQVFFRFRHADWIFGILFNRCRAKPRSKRMKDQGSNGH